MATMLTMFGIALPMSAQNRQKQDALYIYRNDGGFNGFFYGEIDRFEYSKVDTFGVEHDDFVVQEIWARDTVYRIPINAIDSIGFVTPENVYKADVAFTTESDIWNYVIKSDSLTHFVLSANTPSSLIPKVGDKITKTEKTLNLPYGIYGQVVSVDKRADGIAVIFDEIPVGELFDEYTGKFAIRSVPDGDNASSRALIEESWDEVEIETISHEILNEYDFKEWVRYAGTLNFDKEGNFSVGGDFMVRWKTTSEAYIRKVGFIRSNVIFGEHINLHIEQEVTSDFNFNLDGSVNFNAQLPFNPKVPLPLGSTPLKWYIQGGFFANIAGDLSVKEIEHDKTKSVYDFEYSSPISLLTTLSAAAFVPATAPLGLANAVLSSKLKRDVENLEYRNEFSFNTSSTLKMGIFVKLGIVFLTEEIGELSARGDVGVKASGTTPRWMDEIKYIPQSLNEIKNPTGNYDNLKNIDYAEDVTPYVAVQFSFTAGPPKWNTGVSTPSLERDLTSFKSTYVPIFSDVEVDDLGDSDSNLFAKAKVSGPAQNNGAGQEVGFALYNTETNKLVFADFYEKRYTFVDGKPSFTDFSMSIPLKGEKGKLRLYPIVDTNGTYGAMLGTPYRDIDLQKAVLPNFTKMCMEVFYTNERDAYHSFRIPGDTNEYESSHRQHVWLPVKVTLNKDKTVATITGSGELPYYFPFMGYMENVMGKQDFVLTIDLDITNWNNNDILDKHKFKGNVTWSGNLEFDNGGGDPMKGERYVSFSLDDGFSRMQEDGNTYKFTTYSDASVSNLTEKQNTIYIREPEKSTYFTHSIGSKGVSHVDIYLYAEP